MHGLQRAMSPALHYMRDCSVRIAAGSDSGAIPGLAHHRLADGVVTMAGCAGELGLLGLDVA